MRKTRYRCSCLSLYTHTHTDLYLVCCGQIRARHHQDPHYVNAPLLDGEVEARVFLTVSFIHVAALGDSCRHQVRLAQRNRTHHRDVRQDCEHCLPLLFILDLLGTLTTPSSTAYTMSPTLTTFRAGTSAMQHPDGTWMSVVEGALAILYICVRTCVCVCVCV